MDTKYQSLLTPWKIGNVAIKNRIVLTSMGGTNLLGWMEKNHFDEFGARFIMEVAKNNVGLVMPGCQPVYNPMFGKWLHTNKKMYDDLAKWMPELHKTGAKLFVQLTAGFGRSFTISPMMETLYTNPVLKFLSKPVMDLDRITASASSNPNRWSDKVPSREMTKDEIQEVINSFAKSSKLLKDAGVDGVEVHAVHEGYLLDQFALNYTNHREDEYGGSLENRLRFATEIVKAIKAECGKDFPVSLRYSVVSKTKGYRDGAVPEEEYEEVGRDREESAKAAKILEEAGYDMLNCDNGTYDAWYWAHPPIYMPENCNLEDVEYIKQFVSIPVVAAGRGTLDIVAKSIEAGKIDGAGFARNFLADPEWFTKVLDGKEEEIRPCILCHNGCFNMSHYNGVPNDQSLDDSLHLSRCAVNPEILQWDKHYIKKTDNPKTVHIIGGGLGGMEAAIVSKQRGNNPIIYEKTDKLGGIFIPASVTSYKGRLREYLEWMRNEVQKMDIEVRYNTEIKDISQFGDDPVIIATGSRPRFLKSISGYEKMLEACDVLNGEPVGKKVVVVGGGLTGCEIAYELALQDKEITIVEMKNDIVAQGGVCLANSSYLRDWFEWKKVPVHLETSVKEVKDGAVVCKDKDGKEFEIACDTVVSAAGYIPDPLAPKQANVQLVGDCHNVGNVRTVIWGAYEAAMRI
ncbi:MAG: FAD-dependent oxidoreductase [Eubacteriales bacterium]|nr:FAD-dependent oxidoreductase [Eubacteriales bacterium]